MVCLALKNLNTAESESQTLGFVFSRATKLHNSCIGFIRIRKGNFMHLNNMHLLESLSVANNIQNLVSKFTETHDNK